MASTSIFVVFLCTLNIIVYAADNNRPLDCGDIDIKRGSGVYKIYPEGSGQAGFNVYCDMDSENVDGGWTVIQRRLNGEEYFFRGWRDYKEGFGTLQGEHWLGNAKLNILTSQANYELLIRMKTFENENGYARYSDFKVDDDASKFKMTLSKSSFTGNVGDSFGYHSGYKFSTKDQDNDVYTPGGCAVNHKAGWWYGSCHASNLNGLYHAGNHTSYADGVNWKSWKGYHYSLKETTMMIRPLQ
uniref:Fibrinogen-related protein 2 n=1 Tax=Mytilus galloprovincialis TaxID=29158 RepID=E6ZCD4_MYTGA|nr:fibrinogen-related protein 2 [Mytilus galloprovincialis]